MKAWLWVAAFAVALVPLASAETTAKEWDSDDDERSNEWKDSKQSSSPAWSNHDAGDEKKERPSHREGRDPDRDDLKKSPRAEKESRAKAGNDERRQETGDASIPGNEAGAAAPRLLETPPVSAPQSPPPVGTATEARPAEAAVAKPSPPPAAPPEPAAASAAQEADLTPSLPSATTLEEVAPPGPGLALVGTAPHELAEILQNVASPNGSRAAPTQLAPYPAPAAANPVVPGGPEAIVAESLPPIPGSASWSSFAVGALTVMALTAGALGGYTFRFPKRRPAKPAKTSTQPPSLADLLLRIRQTPLDAEAHFDLALELIKLGEAPKAANHLQRSFRLRPDLVMRLLENPAYGPILLQEDVRRILRRFHREQQQKLWAGYA